MTQTDKGLSFPDIWIFFIQRHLVGIVSSTLVWCVSRAVIHRHSGLTREGTSTPSCLHGPPPLPCLSCPCCLRVYRTDKKLVTCYCFSKRCKDNITTQTLGQVMTLKVSSQRRHHLMFGLEELLTFT